jgi:hypothetical protein
MNALIATWTRWRRSLERMVRPRRRLDEVEDLVKHMWIHDGYERNGYWQMTTRQKQLYTGITAGPFSWEKRSNDKVSDPATR